METVEADPDRREGFSFIEADGCARCSADPEAEGLHTFALTYYVYVC
jgi:hypothetical protein